MKGSEDLGGGLHAVFQLENGLNLNNGALAQNGLEFGRQAYLGLSSDRYGTVLLGRQYDKVVDYIGPLIFADGIGTAYSALPGDLNNTNNSTGRVNNAIKYNSPTINGLSFGALYSLGGVAGEPARNQVYSFGVGYTNGPVNAAVAFLHVNQPNSSFFSNSAIAAGSLGTATTSATNSIYGGFANANSYQVAAAGINYAIGPAVIGLVYSNTQFQNLGSGLSSIGNGIPAGTGVGTAIFNAAEVNLTWHFTPALSVGGAYSYTAGSSVQGINNAATGAVGTSGGSKYNEFSLAADYALSARTDTYIAGVYQIASGTDSTGLHAQADLNSLTPSSNNKQAIVRVGLRHKF